MPFCVTDIELFPSCDLCHAFMTGCHPRSRTTGRLGLLLSKNHCFTIDGGWDRAARTGNWKECRWTLCCLLLSCFHWHSLTRHAAGKTPRLRFPPEPTVQPDPGACCPKLMESGPAGVLMENPVRGCNPAALLKFIPAQSTGTSSFPWGMATRHRVGVCT